jgi:hypothetical protein
MASSNQQKAQASYGMPSSTPLFLLNLICDVCIEKEAPIDKIIHSWFSQFKETGSTLKQKAPAKPCTSEESEDCTNLNFIKWNTQNHEQKHVEIKHT